MFDKFINNCVCFMITSARRDIILAPLIIALIVEGNCYELPLCSNFDPRCGATVPLTMRSKKKK